MNDTRELEHGLALIETATKAYQRHPCYDVFERAIAHENFQSLLVFATSFSTERDLLSQWRAYSDDGAGCAIGFHAPALLHLRPLEWPFDFLTKAALYGVIYVEKDQENLAEEIVQKAFGVIELLTQDGDPVEMIPQILQI